MVCIKRAKSAIPHRRSHYVRKEFFRKILCLHFCLSVVLSLKENRFPQIYYAEKLIKVCLNLYKPKLKTRISIICQLSALNDKPASDWQWMTAIMDYTPCLWLYGQHNAKKRLLQHEFQVCRFVYVWVNYLYHLQLKVQYLWQHSTIICKQHTHINSITIKVNNKKLSY